MLLWINDIYEVSVLFLHYFFFRSIALLVGIWCLGGLHIFTCSEHANLGCFHGEGGVLSISLNSILGQVMNYKFLISWRMFFCTVINRLKLYQFVSYIFSLSDKVLSA